MNAAERLWRALASRDWEAVRAQFQQNATVEWPHSGERMDVAAYIAAHRAHHGDGNVEVRHVITEGRLIAVEATAGPARCAGIYDLHDGLIRFATEYWVGHAA
jgi:hypothetical protein